MRQDKFPRPSEDITMETYLQQVPDPPSSTAVPKDVCICFQHPRTLLTPGVIQGSDIPVVEMSTGVETAMEEEPRKELNLGWQFDIPNPRNIRRYSWALKYRVSFTVVKGLLLSVMRVQTSSLSWRVIYARQSERIRNSSSAARVRRGCREDRRPEVMTVRTATSF